MARQVVNKQEFDRALRDVAKRPQGPPSLLAFFLYDERRSHQMVQEFARLQFSWLDRLAGANRMILFLFLPEGATAHSGGSEEAIFVAPGEQTVANPSLEVARQFALGPSELPGVVFFTELDETQPGPHEGVYWPLSPKLFEGDASEAENAFSRLFSLVQEARAEVGDPTRLLAALRRKVDDEHTAQRPEPMLAEARTGLKQVTFSGALTEVTRFAFAQGLG